ncbi:MAG TPA: FhaA domain-containing protein [Candidatus Tumulicola sp.]
MSLFAKLEQACAAFIERSFASAFPTDLEPEQIARKLVATVEARTVEERGKRVAPSRYTVAVNRDDFERLAEHREYLEREWAELLREVSGRVGIALRDDNPVVTMAARDDLPVGAMDVLVEDRPRRAKRKHEFRLRMVRGVPAHGVYAFERTARIGRGDDNDVVLADPSVSRAHAEIETDAAGPLVRDLGSTNGTAVNGKRVRAERLHDGDELSFGNTRMRFEEAAP